MKEERKSLWAARLCPDCRAGVPHHQLAKSSIGGPRVRTVFDLHEIDDPVGVGLRECLAAHVWDRRLSQ